MTHVVTWITTHDSSGKNVNSSYLYLQTYLGEIYHTPRGCLTHNDRHSSLISLFRPHFVCQFSHKFLPPTPKYPVSQKIICEFTGHLPGGQECVGPHIAPASVYRAP